MSVEAWIGMALFSNKIRLKNSRSVWQHVAMFSYAINSMS